jgi:hypothetical protein
MSLSAAGKSIPIAQLGPDFILLRGEADLPPGEAIVKLRVDNVERQWTVQLPEGVSPKTRRVALALANGNAERSVGPES